MWEERERRAQRLRIGVIVLAVLMLCIEWWGSDSRKVPGFVSAFDRLFHDSPQSPPASTPTPPAALPASTRRSDQPSSVGTGGRGGGGLTGNPNYRVDPLVHSDPTVVDPPSHRDTESEKRTPPSDRTPTASRVAPCDSRDETAKQPTDTQRTSKDGRPCEDPSRDRARNADAPPEQ